MGGDNNYISHRIPTREQQKRDTVNKNGATSLMVNRQKYENMNEQSTSNFAFSQTAEGDKDRPTYGLSTQMDQMRQTHASSTKNTDSSDGQPRHQLLQQTMNKGSVTPFNNFSSTELRNNTQSEEAEDKDGYRLSQISQGYSERDVIAYLVK